MDIKQERKQIIQEVVLFKDNAADFVSDERRAIRDKLKANGVKVRCVFIQERDFKCISTKGWRETFYEVVCMSRNT